MHLLSCASQLKIPVDGLRLDATDGEEAAAAAGADPHGEHALEQGLALAPAVTWVMSQVSMSRSYLVTHDDRLMGSSVKVALTLQTRITNTNLLTILWCPDQFLH